MKNNEEIIFWLKKNLDDERFLHSLGVADCAKELAIKYNLDPEKAYLAGLLHDCAKCQKNEDLKKILEEKMHCDMEELLNPKTYHSPAGAYFAKEIFKVEDEEILNAIYCHTVGKEQMTTFEKIIFLADKIEPNTRNKDWRNKILEILEEENGLNKALLACYEYTIKSLVDRRLKICLTTIRIYNELLDNINA
ncbi:bis(5'-nucleosyl)-tetraphosphatase (symmetrical) YqeK [bacterium]|nr:bis(5'-nucleosyl)-tetraphosphatase (symmetrical) YqeK [bacterium]